MWLELALSRAGTALRVGARGSRGEQTAPRELGPDLDADAVSRFASAVRVNATRGRMLPPDVLEEAQAIHRSILVEDIAPLLSRLAEAAGGPLLLRLDVPEAELQGVPWEALCAPGQAMGFWASSPDILPVRAVTTNEPWQPRAVRGAVRIRAIAPMGSAALLVLKDALEKQIESGEVEWLEPIEGPSVTPESLFDQLRREPVPHIVHFLGHGSVHNGVPVLRLADNEDGEETWLPVELFAQQLKASLRGFLRLIVLECCEGARPAAFASAAEILARAGADAVVAHLWPVKADVARTCSTNLYRALAGGDRSKGDIAAGINEARRAILGAYEGSAQAFSPILYLRGPDGVLFNLKGRKLEKPAPGVAAKTNAPGNSPTLGRLFGKPFSLLVGDLLPDQVAALGALRDKLHKELAKASVPTKSTLPLPVLAQRFALHRGQSKLAAEFQKAFRSAADVPPVLKGLGRVIGPGVHTTLLRHPMLEHAIAEHHPQRTLYVVQLGDDCILVARREGGSEDWEEIDAASVAFDPDEEIMLLRLYGGDNPGRVFSQPPLTGEDYIIGLSRLPALLPTDLSNAIQSTLSFRPALLMRLSLYAGQHRALLRRLYPRGVPRGSVALVDPEQGDRDLWETGSGLPGKDAGVEVVSMSFDDFSAALEEMGGER